MAEPERPTTRRRRRGVGTARPDEAAPPESRQEPQSDAPADQGAARRAAPRPKPRGEAADRGMRGLVGAGPSQVGVSGALRGRDVNRPSEEDLARAERDVVIVRRNWKPPA